MAIGAPVLLGDAHSGASSTTLSITTGTDAPAGSLVVVFAHYKSNAAITGVTDSAGNTYAALTSFSSPSFRHARAFWSLTAADLPASGTITVTFASATTNSKLASAAAVSGIAASPLDQNGSGANGTSTSPSYTSGALASANEIVFGLLTVDGGSPTITEGSGFTALDTVSTDTTLHWAYAIVASTSAVAYAPTLGASAGWAANVASFEGAAGAASPAFDFRQRHFYLEW